MASSNNNPLLNLTTTPNKKNYTKIIRVKESKEFMTQLAKCSEILEDNSDKMEENVYLNLYNELMNLYCLDLTMDICVKAGGREINQHRVHMTYEQKRKAIENGDPRKTCCPKCLRIISKIGVKQHQRTDICKDNRVVFGVTNADLEGANAKAVDEYILEENQSS